MAFSARDMFVFFLVISLASLMGLKFWSDQGLVSEGKFRSETSSEERLYRHLEPGSDVRNSAGETELKENLVGEGKFRSKTPSKEKLPRRLAPGSGVRDSANETDLKESLERIPDVAQEEAPIADIFPDFYEVARRIKSVEKGLRGETLFEDGDLASNLLVERIWDDNRLMKKLKEARLKQIAGEDGECVIKVMAWCGTKFCGPLSNKPVAEYTCRFSTCAIQYKVGQSIRLFENSDVVIFMPGLYEWDILLSKRPPGQIWVMQSKESPNHWHTYSPPREAGNPFNLSVTFMSDTDIYIPYFYFQPNESSDNLKSVSSKTMLMSFFASNCNKTSWNRLGLINAMQKYLPIDTYGDCGTQTCPKFSSECADLPTRFKFNFAFENSQCPEYITEKFWYNALMQGVVPVVFGAPREDYLRLAPPKSYIHLEDFDSVQEFADFIKKLDRNGTLYAEYFEWRKLGTIRKGSFTGMMQNRYHTNVNLCYIIRILIDKFCHPSKYPWQRRNPIFYDWWTGKCKPKEYVMGEYLNYGNRLNEGMLIQVLAAA